LIRIWTLLLGWITMPELRKYMEENDVDEKMFEKLVEFLKDELDKYFGKLWNVIIIYGRYWSRYCHETGYNFCFIKDDRIFLVYKIPDI
ncbi:uncharacterized protein DC041_0007042, partial [Schistosoma bovis]